MTDCSLMLLLLLYRVKHAAIHVVFYFKQHRYMPHFDHSPRQPAILNVLLNDLTQATSIAPFTCIKLIGLSFSTNYTDYH
jgi:hypothetical protein